MILPIDPYETRLPPVALGWGSYLPSRGESKNSVDFDSSVLFIYVLGRGDSSRLSIKVLAF